MSDKNLFTEIALESPILVVDDDSDALSSLMRSLRASGLPGEIRGAANGSEAQKIAASLLPGVAIIDLSLNPEEGVESGFNLLTHLTTKDPTLRVIVLTGHGSFEHGLRALGSGAASFLEKPANIRHLSALVRDHLLQNYYHRQYDLLQKEAKRPLLESLIAGQSEAANKIREEIDFLCHTPQTVFITGETGVGKSHVAKLIHTLGPQRALPFLTFNPTVNQLDLATSELFGHKKGSFTGATEDKPGLFELVGNGTLFFDEIDELPNDIQVALLRVIQERSYRMRGGKEEHTSKARLIFASNRNPQDAIASGKLRQDLYHRAAQLSLHIPALRERKDDIETLAQHFITRTNEREQFTLMGIHQDALDILKTHTFPGNIRELEACIETACYRAEYKSSKVITAEHLRLLSQPSSKNSNKDFRSLVEDYQLKLINEALEKHGGNQAKAAEDLQLDRSTLRRILGRLQ